MSSPDNTQSSLGKALQRIFQQEDLIRKIEDQDSTSSFFMSDIRREILFHLVGHPCDHLRGIATQVSVKPPSASWHLTKLLDAGILGSSTFRNKKVYWVAGIIDKAHVDTLSFLGDRVGHDIILALAMETDGMRENALYRALGIRQQTLFKRLHDLENAGLIKSTGKGYGRVYVVGELLHDLDTHYRENAYDNQLALMELLVKDGLRPKLRKRLGSRLYLDLDIPGKKEKRKVDFNPLADLDL